MIDEGNAETQVPPISVATNFIQRQSFQSFKSDKRKKSIITNVRSLVSSCITNSRQGAGIKIEQTKGGTRHVRGQGEKLRQQDGREEFPLHLRELLRQVRVLHHGDAKQRLQLVQLVQRLQLDVAEQRGGLLLPPRDGGGGGLPEL